MQARDVMTTNVVSVSESAPVHEVVALLLKHRISAVPVVNEAGRVVGMVSEGDLLRPEGSAALGSERAWWLAAILAGEGGMGTYSKARGETAGAVMSRKVITVTEETSLPQIASMLERFHIKRVPVVRNGVLVGIVSRANLLHGLANTIIERHEPGAAQDRDLRDHVMAALLGNAALGPVLVNVTAHEGAVRLWGRVDSTAQVEAAEQAAKAVPGVRSVENNLSLGPISGVPV